MKIVFHKCQLLLALLIAALLLSVSCDEEDPGAFDIKGWILRCEDRCEQLSECNHDQFMWNHGDMDNCKRSCNANLKRAENVEFVETSPKNCVEKLYASLKCIHSLGCSKLTKWKKMDGTDYPCATKEKAANTACKDIFTQTFLKDCNYPFRVTH